MLDLNRPLRRLLHPPSLNVLHHASSATLGQPDLAVADLVDRIAVRRHKIDGDSIRPRSNHEHRGDNHSEARAVVHVGHMAQEGRHDGTTANTADDEARPAFVVAAQAADTQGDDGGEADRLKEHGDEKHGWNQLSVTYLPESQASGGWGAERREHTNSILLPLGDRRSEERHHARKICQEDPAGTHVFHEQGAGEAADGEGALRTGEVL